MDKINNTKLRFAACSKDGDLIDQHFGHTTTFFIYDYVEDKVVLAETRNTEQYCTGQAEDDDRMQNIAQMLSDCDYILCVRIGPYPEQVLKENGIQIFTTYNRIEDGIKELLQNQAQK